MHRCKPAAFDSSKPLHVLLIDVNQRVLEPAKQVIPLSKYMQWLLPAAHVTHLISGEISSSCQGGWWLNCWLSRRLLNAVLLKFPEGFSWKLLSSPFHLGSRLVVVVGGEQLS